MEQILQIVQTMLVVSLIICVVWLIDKTTKKQIGYRWRKILWLILAIRLLLPMPINLNNVMDSFRGFEVTVEMPQSMKKAEQLSDSNVSSAKTNTEIAVQNGVNNDEVIQDSGVNSSVAEKKANVESTLDNNNEKQSIEISVMDVILAIYLLGVVFVFALRIFQYIGLKKKYLNCASPCTNQMYLTKLQDICKEYGIKGNIPMMVQKKIGSPMLCGYFHTVLLLPEISYLEEEMDCVLRHELTHFKSRDLWYKLFIGIASDVYWFNPLMILMKRMAFQDVEYVCDKRATKRMAIEDKGKYSSTILKTMRGPVSHRSVYTTQFGGNKKMAKGRIENIFSSPKAKYGISLLVLLIGMIFVGTACVSVKTKTEGESKEAEKTAFTIDSYLLEGADESILDEFGKKYPQYSVSSEEFQYQNLDISDTSDDAPTIFSIPSVDAVSLGFSKKAADITDVLEKRGWLEQMDASAKKMVSDENGRIYGIPSSAYVMGLMCNVESFKEAGLVDEAGVPVFPTTWEELADTAVKIKKATGKAGFCLLAEDYAGAWEFENIAWNFGATDLCKNNGDGTYEANLDSDSAIKAMEYVKALKWDYDVLTENPEKENYSTCFEQLGKGTTAMCIGANDMISMPISYGMKSDNLAMTVVPYDGTNQRYSLYGSLAFAFSSNATEEEIDAALTLIEMMGMGPVSNDAAKKIIQDNINNSISVNAPVIPQIHTWNNQELLNYEQDKIKEAGNTNQAMFQSYFDGIAEPESLKCDEPEMLSEFYDIISGVLKKVVTDKDADVASLMKAADEQYQKILDAN